MRLKPAEDLKLVENSNAHNNLRSSTLTGSDGNRNNQTATDKFTTFNQSPQWSSPWSEQTATAELVANINFRVTSPSKHQQQQQPQEQPFSPDDSLADYEEGQEESWSSGEDLSPEGECSDSEYDSLPLPPRGIVNPNYPGFQHLAHRLVPPYDDDNNNNEDDEEDYGKGSDSVNKLDSPGPTLKAVYARPKLNIPLDSVEVDSDTDKSENCNSCAGKDSRRSLVLGKSYKGEPEKGRGWSDRSCDSDTSGEELSRNGPSSENVLERQSSPEEADQLNSIVDKLYSCTETHSKPRDCRPSVEKNNAYTEKSRNGKSGVDNPSAYEVIPGVDKSYPSDEKAYKLNPIIGKRNSCTEGDYSVDKAHNCDSSLEERNSYTEKSYNKPHDRDPSAYEVIASVDNSYTSVEKAYKLSSTLGKRDSCTEGYPSVDKAHNCDSKGKENNSYTEKSDNGKSGVDKPHDRDPSAYEVIPSVDKSYPSVEKTYKLSSTLGKRDSCTEGYPSVDNAHDCDPKGKENNSYTEKSHDGKSGVDKSYPSDEKAYELNQIVGKRNSCSERSHESKEKRYSVSRKRNSYENVEERVASVEDSSVRERGSWTERDSSGERGGPERGRSGRRPGAEECGRATRKPLRLELVEGSGGPALGSEKKAMAGKAVVAEVLKEAYDKSRGSDRANNNEECRLDNRAAAADREKKEKMDSNLSVQKGGQPANHHCQLPPANMQGPPHRQRRTKRPQSDHIGGFDVYNIETAMPKIDLEAIESHLRAAREEERRRRNDREEIRRRLATGCDADEYYGGDRPGKKPSLQARLQSGMNLQICFMNETMSDTESPCSEVAPPPAAAPREPLAAPLPLTAAATAALAHPPTNLDLNNKSCTETERSIIVESGGGGGGGGGGGSFAERQARLQAEARAALSQAKDLARTQMQAERQRRRSSPITDMLRASLRKVGIALPEGRRRVSRQMLTDMNVAQLQVIVNDLHTQIEQLNEGLVKYLMERDELHMSQDSMLVDIEDLTRYLGAKESVTREEMTSRNNNVSRRGATGGKPRLRQQPPPVVVVGRVVPLARK